jgi:hypothetical protein
MIIGGIAVMAHGVARTTRDVGATIATVRDVGQVFAELARFEIHPRIDDAIPQARTSQVLLLRHAPSGVDVDLSLAWLPFELDALARAEDMLLGSVEVTVARAEDLVIYKAVAWRLEDQEDVARLVALHGKTMDFVRIRRVVAEFAESLEDSQRVVEVERVLERALGLVL